MQLPSKIALIFVYLTVATLSSAYPILTGLKEIENLVVPYATEFYSAEPITVRPTFDTTTGKTTTTTKASDGSSKNPTWYYFAGAGAGMGILGVFVFVCRQIKMRYFPKQIYKKMYKDLLTVKKNLPENVQQCLEDAAMKDFQSSVCIKDREYAQSLKPIRVGAQKNDYRPYTLDPSATRPTDPWEISALYTDDEHHVAIKMAHTHASDKDKMDLLQEIEFMKTLDVHPHVLGMLGCSKDFKQPLIVMELCDRGDLLSVLRNSRDPEYKEKLTNDDLVPLAWQISDALAYLSSRNMIHRDVAARNVLLTKEKMAKLSDFGLCRLSSEMFYTTRGGKLPIKWMAPESLETAVFSEKTDVWSFGVFLFELFTYGTSPYMAIDPERMLEHLKEGNRLELPEESPERIVKLLASCSEFDAAKRPNFQQIRSELYDLVSESTEQYGYLEFRKNYYDFVVAPKHCSSSENL
ncbi:unnamed protein product, partial [Mesorhabditis spiculigera]